MEIIPAILPRDFKEIEEKTFLIKDLAKLVQIDICDGIFVKNITWPYKKNDEHFEAIIHEDRGMPFWEVLDYEFDLMMGNPVADDVRKWLSAGAKKIILHAESSPDLEPTMKVLSGLVEIGLALNVSTSLDAVEKYKDKISYLQFMGISKVGFQGQPFDAGVLEKIKESKAKYPDLKVQIDGGVNLETALLLKEAGADRLIVGSALFGAENIVDTFRKFKAI